MRTSNLLLPKTVTRRQALKTLSLVPVAIGLGSLARLSQAADLLCGVAPSMTEGPYWVDEGLNRFDITTNTTRSSVLEGLPFNLNLQVFNTSNSACSETVVPNVQLDIWHADTSGEYSDASGNGQTSTIGQTFLRGYQVSNSEGVVNFKSIYPGWYTGRATHIHLRARTYDSNGNNTYDFTTQLFFDDTTTDTVYATAPYNTRGNRDTRNSTDMHYLGVDSPLLLNLTENSDGSMTGNIAIGLSGVDSAPVLNQFNVTTTASGSHPLLTLTSELTVKPADVGNTGNIYVLALLDGVWFINNGQTWELYSSTSLNNVPALFSGTLSTMHRFELLTGMDVSALKGIQFYAGYGESAEAMLQNGQYRMTYAL